MLARVLLHQLASPRIPPARMMTWRCAASLALSCVHQVIRRAALHALFTSSPLTDCLVSGYYDSVSNLGLELCSACGRSFWQPRGGGVARSVNMHRDSQSCDSKLRVSDI